MKKNKDLGVIIFSVIIVFIVISGFLLRFLSNRTKKSAPEQYGNTAGNLYNLGLYCDDGKRIYFSNLNDQGMLYSMNYDMDDFVLIEKDNARYINTDDNYIIYSRMNNLKDEAARSIFIFYSNGIFRVGKNGHNLKMLWEKPVGSVLLYNNQVFFQHYKEGEKLSTHRIDIDGDNDKVLFADDTVAVSLYNGKLYYAGKLKDRDLHSGTIAEGSTKVELEGGFYNPIVNSDGVYYIDVFNNYKLMRCDHDGSNKETLVKGSVSTYNFSTDGRYIFYQYDKGDDSGLHKLELATGEDELIKQGNFKWINTVHDCCFFVAFDETAMYCYRPGKGLTWFDPPVLSN